MQLQCPCCGEQFPHEAGFADEDGKRLAALLAGVEPKLGRAVLNYLRLFSPASRGLRTTKAIKLVEELVGLIESGQVQRDARTNDAKPAPPRLWTAGIEQMIAQRERLSLPLTTTVNQLFTQMIAAGDGELDHCAILRQIRRLNGERL